MKKALIVSLICCSTLLGSTSFAKGTQESLDKIVAIVNDDVVTSTELSHAMVILKMQLAQENIPTPSEEVVKKQLLDQLINKKLQLQVAKTAGLHISDSEVNETIQRVAEQNHVTPDELFKQLASQHMSEKDYREEIRDQLTIQRLQQQELAGKVNVSSQEVKNFMRSKAWKKFGAKEYHLEDILVPISDAPSAEEITAAKNQADVIVQKLQQGQPFQTVVQAESAENKIQGGDLGWLKLSEIPTAFAQQVASMQANQTAGPIQTGNGFHVIYLEGLRTADQNGAPTLKQVEGILMQKKFEEAARNMMSKLRSQAFIVTNPQS